MCCGVVKPVFVSRLKRAMEVSLSVFSHKSWDSLVYATETSTSSEQTLEAVFCPSHFHTFLRKKKTNQSGRACLISTHTGRRVCAACELTTPVLLTSNMSLLLTILTNTAPHLKIISSFRFGNILYYNSIYVQV